MLTLTDLLDETRCFALLREQRWPDGVSCPRCGSVSIVKNGHVATQPARQQYRCDGCARWFDDLTGTVLDGRRHAEIRSWVLCLYLMGLNLSNRQIAQELDLSETDAQERCTALRDTILAHQQPIVLSGEVECDEVYIVAGHKGHPAAVAAQGRPGRRRRLKGERGRGTLAKEHPPVFGMVERKGGRW